MSSQVIQRMFGRGVSAAGVGAAEANTATTATRRRRDGGMVRLGFGFLSGVHFVPYGGSQIHGDTLARLAYASHFATISLTRSGCDAARSFVSVRSDARSYSSHLPPGLFATHFQSPTRMARLPSCSQ